ncbi:TPMT [Mytilus edulis]|uniref:thiopurine S-methyltransferase n=2 Tax=Mytilus edulis TaxID=6550 RepID=A0A8S3SZF9_MYTED|nr:TPMT [Mytilus edulis]
MHQVHEMFDWKDAWEKDNAVWHMDGVNSTLEKHLDKITGKENKAKLFVPLCGKTLDMLHLSKMGHEVVGVEFSELAVRQFFEENSVPCTASSVSSMGGMLYKNDDYRIRIYCGDFFKFGSHLEKDFDGVWDRGALEAIEPKMRKTYIDIMKSILKPGAGYILDTADRPIGIGPPFFISVDEIVEHFGLKSQPEQIDYEIAEPDLQAMGCAGLFFYYFLMP